MTIACCYVSPEGVVFGADSTTSYGLADGPHYFNHAQKVFEVGEKSTLAAMFWGLASLGPVSFRTLVAELGDDLAANAAADVADVATRWAGRLHAAYHAAYGNTPEVLRATALSQKGAFVNGAVADPDMRTEAEEEEFQNLRLVLQVGSCIGGRVNDRTPAAYFLHIEPYGPVPQISAVPMNTSRFWGAPNMFDRLIMGADQKTFSDILNSGFWNGSAADLETVLAPSVLHHPIIPLREVVDFVHTCVHSTIKALKFSQFQQICGGQVELAVISTDRNFRWVRHKEWNVAVGDGGLK